MTVLTRASKGSQLTWAEVDENFTTLRDVAAQTSGTLNGVVIGATTPAALSATTGAFSGDVTRTSSNNGAGNYISVKNTSNTAESGAILSIQTGGASGGSGVVQYYNQISVRYVGFNGAFGTYFVSTDPSGASPWMAVNASGMNGVLGATTPAAATVTTLSATGAVIAAGTGATLASTISMNANTTGQPAYFTAAGTDTNVGIDLNTKGTGNARTNVNGSVVTVTSSAGLAVTGALSATGAPTSATSGLDTLWYNNTGDYSAQWIRHDRASGGTAAKMISFADSSNTVVGSITANGTTTAYNTTSPRHLKQNITDADREVSRKIVMTTRIREYEWMRFPGKKHIGVVVDEVIRSGFRGAVYKNAYGGAEAVDKTAWVFHSVATLQIHDAEIQSALSRLAKLEAAAAAAGWAV